MSQRLNYSVVAPEGVKAMGGVYAYIRQCGLPATLIDLVYLRISQLNGCAFCIDMHSHDLQDGGVPIEKILLVSAWDEAREMFAPREQAALAWAESVTGVAQTHVPDHEYHAASREFSEKELADLTIAVALMNAYNRLAISFRRTPRAVKDAQRTLKQATAAG